MDKRQGHLELFAKQTFKLPITRKILQLACLPLFTRTKVYTEIWISNISWSSAINNYNKHDHCEHLLSGPWWMRLFLHWIEQATTHHRPRHCSWTSSGEGHFVNNWKKCACYSLLRIQRPHYLLRLSLPILFLSSEDYPPGAVVCHSGCTAKPRGSPGECCGPASVYTVQYQLSKDKSHQY